MTHLAHHPIVALAGQTVARVLRIFKNRHQAAKLSALSDEQLKDIGLTRSDVRSALALPLRADLAPVLTDLAYGSSAAVSNCLPAAANSGVATSVPAVRPVADHHGIAA